jgi:hypothetical protein
MVALAARAVTSFVAFHRGIYDYCEQRLDARERIAPSMGLKVFYNRRMARSVAGYLGYETLSLSGSQDISSEVRIYHCLSIQHLESMVL